MFILDTDHASLWLRGNASVIAKVTQSRPNVVLTIITVQEIFNGWVGRLNNLAERADFTAEYENLWEAIEFIRGFPALKFDTDADDCYIRLLQSYPSLRKKLLRQDMRIAAIALSQNATVLTRNRRDFEQVPGLKIEDWSI
jgi:tRNA(fMet)-specific endonuclease VapC